MVSIGLEDSVKDLSGILKHAGGSDAQQRFSILRQVYNTDPHRAEEKPKLNLIKH